MPALYTVRLGFSALAGDKPAQRIFDIKLQDKVVLKNFDILKEATKPNKAVIKEFKGITVNNTLTLELLSTSANPDSSNAPIINFIEIAIE